jgi:Carboxypeptidase regulatory-like domain
MVLRTLTALLLAFSAVAFGAAQQDSPTPPPQPEIRGVVLEPGTNQPVVDAEISLSVQAPGPVKINGGWKADPSRKSRTDFSGAFRLPLDKPGPYRVEATKPGYFAPAAGGPNYREVTLTAESPVAEVKMYLAQPGRITGLVVDEETGKPIAKLYLRAARMNARLGGFEPGGTPATTDSDGQFAVTGLGPGEYAMEIHPQAAQDKRVLTQTPKDSPTAEPDYEHTYWPGGHGEDAALPVTIGSGVTVHIGKLPVRKVPYYRVHLRIPVSNCEAGDTLLVGESFQGGRSRWQHSLASVPCGKDLYVTGFSPGTYGLMLSNGGGPPENLATAFIPFSIVDRNLELTAPLARGVAMDGVFVAEDGTKLPDLANTKISLRATDQFLASMGAGMPVSPTPDGKFRLEGVRPVDQIVLVYGLGTGNYVKEIRYNGAAASEDIVALESGARAHKLTIVVDDKPGTITGAVMSGGGPVSRPFVLAKKWPPQAVQTPSGMAGTRGDEAGQFRIGGLVPGEYHVIALRSVDQATNQAAADRALAAAKKIEVGPGNVLNVTLEVTELR